MPKAARNSWADLSRKKAVRWTSVLERKIPVFPFLQDVGKVYLAYPSFTRYAYLLVEALQLLSFALCPHHRWGRVLTGILQALYFTHFPLYESFMFAGFIASLVLWTVIFCAVASILALGLFHVWWRRHLRGLVEDSGGFMFFIGSSVCWLLSGVFLVPLLQNVIALGFCQQTVATRRHLLWYPEQQCARGVALFALLVCIFGVALTIFLGYLRQAVFDHVPYSRRIDAHIDNTAHVLNLYYLLICSVLMHYFYAIGGMVYFAVWMAVSSLGLAVVWMVLMPHYHAHVNRIRVTSLLLASFYAVFAAISHAGPVGRFFEANKHADVGLVLGLLPIVGPVFWRLALPRVSPTFLRAFNGLREGTLSHPVVHFPLNLPRSVELLPKNRAILQGLHDSNEKSSSEWTTLGGGPRASGNGSISYAVPSPMRSKRPSRTSEDEEDALSWAFDPVGLGPLVDGGCDSGMVPPLITKLRRYLTCFTVPYIDRVLVVQDVELATRFLLEYSQETEFPLSDYQLHYAAIVFVKGCARFLESAKVQFAFAVFLHYHADRSLLAWDQLGLGIEAEPSFTDAFHMWQLREVLSTELQLGLTGRAEAFQRGRTMHRAAMGYSMDFWNLLTSDDVDQKAVLNTNHETLRAMQECNDTYRALIACGMCNDEILACYTLFCDTMLGKSEMGVHLLQLLRDTVNEQEQVKMRGARSHTALYQRMNVSAAAALIIQTSQGATLMGGGVASSHRSDRLDLDSGTSGTELSRGSNSSMQSYLRNLSIFLWTSTLFVLAIFIGLIIVVVYYNNDILARLTGVYVAGRLRGQTVRASVAASQMQQFATTGNTSKVEAMANQVMALQMDYMAHLNSILFGEFTYNMGNIILDQRYLTISRFFVHKPMFQWEFLNAIGVALYDVAINPYHSPFLQWVTSMPFTTKSAMAANITLDSYANDAMGSTYHRLIITLVMIMVILALVTLLGVVLLQSLNKIDAFASSTFYLFTLIPKEDVQRFFRNSQRRLAQLETFLSLSSKEKVNWLLTPRTGREKEYDLLCAPAVHSMEPLQTETDAATTPECVTTEPSEGASIRNSMASSQKRPPRHRDNGDSASNRGRSAQNYSDADTSHGGGGSSRRHMGSSRYTAEAPSNDKPSQRTTPTATQKSSTKPSGVSRASEGAKGRVATTGSGGRGSGHRKKPNDGKQAFFLEIPQLSLRWMATTQLLGVLLIAMVVLQCIVITKPPNDSAYYLEAMERRKAVLDLQTMVAISGTSSFAFVLSGIDSFFYRFISMYNTGLEWDHAAFGLKKRAASEKEMMRFFDLVETYDAIMQWMFISLRLASLAYPDAVRTPRLSVNDTILSTLSWGAESTIPLVQKISRFGVYAAYPGILSGSEVDLALPAEDQLALSRRMFEWDGYSTAMETLLREINAVLDPPLERVVVTLTRPLFITIIALASTAIAVSVLLGGTSQFSTGLLRRKEAILVMGTIAVCMTACLSMGVVQYVMLYDDVLSGYVEATRSFASEWIVAGFKTHFYPLAYLSSGGTAQKWLLRYINFISSINAGILVKVVTDLHGDNVNRALFSDLVTSTQLSRIAVSLVLSVARELPSNDDILPYLDLRVIDAVEWDFAKEPTYQLTVAQFGQMDNYQFYSTKALDLAKPAADRLLLAQHTIISNRFTYTMDRATEIFKLFGTPVESAVENKQRQWGWQRGMRIAGIVASTIPLLLFLVAMIAGYLRYTKVCSSHITFGRRSQTKSMIVAHKGSDRSSSSSSHQRYDFRRIFPFVGLTVMLLLCAGLVVVVVLLTASVQRTLQIVGDSSLRLWSVAYSLKLVDMAATDPSSWAVMQGLIRSEYYRIMDLDRRLYFDSRAAYFAVAHDKVQDAMLFSRSKFYHLAPTMEYGVPQDNSSIGLARADHPHQVSGSGAMLLGPNLFGTTAPVTLSMQQLPLFCDEKRQTLLAPRYSRGVALVMDEVWTSMLRRILTGGPEVLAGVRDEMLYFYDALVVGLQESDHQYFQMGKREMEVFFALMVVLLAVGALLVLTMQLCLNGRFLAYLHEEERNARFLLEIVPRETQDANKRIVAFLKGERGRSYTEELEAVIATMSASATVVVDFRGVILRFNALAEAMFGWSSDEVIGKNVSVLVPEDVVLASNPFVAPFREEADLRALEAPREFLGRHRSGNVFNVEMRGTMIRYSNDERILVTFLEHAANRYELALLHCMNDLLLNASSDPVIVMDSFGIITASNAAVTMCFGYDQTQLIGENVKILMPPEVAMYHDGFLTRFRSSTSRKPLQRSFDTRAQRKNGSLFSAKITVYEVPRLGSPSILIGSFEDTTRQMQVEMSSSVTDAIIDLSPIPVIAINEHGTIVSFSRAACELFQYSKEEIYREGLHLNAIVPDRYGDHDVFMRRYLRTKSPHVIGTTRSILAKKRDGTHFPSVLTVRSIEQEGTSSIYLGYLEDISKKLAQEDSCKLMYQVSMCYVTPVIATTRQGIIYMVNKAAAELFQYTIDEMVGQNVKLIMTEYVARFHDKYLANYQRTQEQHIIGSQRSVQGRCKDGSLIAVQLLVNEVPGTNMLDGGFFAFLQCLTEQDQETMRHYYVNASISALSYKAIITVSNTGIVESFSAAAEEYFGYSVMEVEGVFLDVLFPSIIVDGNSTLSRGSTIHDAGESISLLALVDETLIIRARHCNGKLFDMEATARVVLDPETGAKSGIVIYCNSVDRFISQSEMVDFLRDTQSYFAMPLVQFDSTGKCLGANSSFATMFDYNVNAEVPGTPLARFMKDTLEPQVHGLVERLNEAMVASPEGRGGYRILENNWRCTGRRKDGQLFQLEARIIGVSVMHMEIPYTFIAYITNRHEVREQERMLELTNTFVDFSPVPIVVIGKHGIILHFSAAATAAFGYAEAEVVGKNIKVLTPDEAFAREAFSSDRFMDGDGSTSVHKDQPIAQVAQRKDGTTFSCEILVRMSGTRERPLFIATIRDTTEEVQLQELAKFTGLMIETSATPTVVINYAGSIVEFNAAACSMFGYPSAAEVMGKDVGVLMGMDDAKYHPRHLLNYARSRLAFAVNNTVQRLARSRSGAMMVVDVTLREVRGVTGSPVDTIFVAFLEHSRTAAKSKLALTNPSIMAIEQATVNQLLGLMHLSLNHEGMVLDASPTLVAQLGMDPAHIMGREFAQVVTENSTPPFSGSKVVEDFFHNSMGVPLGTQTSLVVSVANRAGEMIPMRLTMVEMDSRFSPDGQRIFIVSFSDINTELKMEWQSIMYEEALRTSSTAVVTMDMNGTITFTNAACDMCFGYGPRELVGLDVSVLMPSASARLHQTFVDTYLRTHVKHAIGGRRTVTARHRDGTWFSASLAVCEVNENGVRHFGASLTDRTQLMEMEQALVINRSILSTTRRAILVADSHFSVTLASDAACALFGYRRDELIGQDMPSLLFAAPVATAFFDFWKSNERRWRSHSTTGRVSFLDTSRTVIHGTSGDSSGSVTSGAGMGVHAGTPPAGSADGDTSRHRKRFTETQVSMRRKDGRAMVVDIISEAVRGADGAPRGYVTLFVEEAAFAPESVPVRLADATLSALPMPTFVVNQIGAIVRANTPFARLLQHSSPSAIVGKSISAFLTEADMPAEVMNPSFSLRHTESVRTRHSLRGDTAAVDQSPSSNSSSGSSAEDASSSDSSGSHTESDDEGHSGGEFNIISDEVMERVAKVFDALSKRRFVTCRTRGGHHLQAEMLRFTTLSNDTINAFAKRAELVPAEHAVPSQPSLSVTQASTSTPGKSTRAGGAKDWYFYLGVLVDVEEKQSAAIASILATNLLSRNPSAFVGINAKGIIRVANQPALDLFDFTEASLIGQNVSVLMPTEIAGMHDRYLDTFFRSGKRTMLNGTRRVHGETRTGVLIPLDVTIREVMLQGDVAFIALIAPAPTDGRAPAAPPPASEADEHLT